MAGKEYLVLSAVGDDRPGLVERISTMIHVSGANLEDSRMAILGGEFALILLISGTADALAAVERSGPAVAEELDLRLSFKPTARKVTTPDYLPYRLKVSGIDRPGIVARVSGVLAKRSINVAAFDSRLTYAPLSGTPLFQLHARLQVPSQVALASLRSDVGGLCEEENLDFQLESDDSD